MAMCNTVVHHRGFQSADVQQLHQLTLIVPNCVTKEICGSCPVYPWSRFKNAITHIIFFV